MKGVTFKMDAETLDAASKVLKENGYSLTKGMTTFLTSVAITKTVDLPDVEELENEALFKALQKEIRQSVDRYEEGNHGHSIEEARERLGL